MRAALPAMLIPPLIFWACSEEPQRRPSPVEPRDGGFADAAAFADAETNADASGFADAETNADAETFADAAAEEDASTPACAYPTGAREPMALNEVISPYSWPMALNGAGENKDINLEQIFCDNDPDLVWTNTGHLLFVSIPAW
jgi:hypothetical protein